MLNLRHSSCCPSGMASRRELAVYDNSLCTHGDQEQPNNDDHQQTGGELFAEAMNKASSPRGAQNSTEADASNQNPGFGPLPVGPAIGITTAPWGVAGGIPGLHPKRPSIRITMSRSLANFGG